jgi:hypothetical protein
LEVKTILFIYLFISLIMNIVLCSSVVATDFQDGVILKKQLTAAQFLAAAALVKENYCGHPQTKNIICRHKRWH